MGRSGIIIVCRVSIFDSVVVDVPSKEIVSYARINQLSVIAVDWTLTDRQREIAMLHFGISKFTT